ncbi:hypothetical protein HY78_15690 [Rhizorhabdus wittichii DC-6]|nr:hypothetical protein HY78_15690 [Rhizorhabdus wittichii DC-6]
MGRYLRTRVIRLPRPIVGIGRRWISLTPQAGQALEAEKAGRDGLGIQAGRGDERLLPTYGGIRILERDMSVIERLTLDLPFYVLIKRDKNSGSRD